MSRIFFSILLIFGFEAGATALTCIKTIDLPSTKVHIKHTMSVPIGPGASSLTWTESSSEGDLKFEYMMASLNTHSPVVTFRVFKGPIWIFNSGNIVTDPAKFVSPAGDVVIEITCSIK